MKDLDLWENEKLKCKKLNINKKKDDIFDTNTTKELFKNLNKNKEDPIWIDEDKDIKFNNFSLKKGESLGIDRNTDKKLRLGKYPIDKTIDFHGLTLNQAFDSLLFNINDSYYKNLRCLLIITGKGKKSLDQNRNTIRFSFEKWMKHDNISSKVIKYVNAMPKDGGDGAFYILLKNN